MYFSSLLIERGDAESAVSNYITRVDLITLGIEINSGGQAFIPVKLKFTYFKRLVFIKSQNLFDFPNFIILKANIWSH